jgi:primosomal protein N' (replication factor Y)
MRGSMSVALYEAVKQSLDRKEQAILLFNRRGFANYLQCDSCGHIPKSPDSSVSLTYHKRYNMLMCHYSGYSRKLDSNCEVCGSDKLLIQGSGTQKIEEEVQELFPEAKVIRFDKDSTTKKGSHERILSAFGNKEADILVGTQLVSKGLDFPDVTTVGVIDADTEQAFPSFNASERLYQLLSQVAGRSGRGEKKGKVFIQTRQSDNPSIQFAKYHDFDGFAEQEKNFRNELGYPPYSRLIQFIFKGKDEHKVIQSARVMERIISQALPNNTILGPSSSVISWLNGMYFWELSLKIDIEKGANYIEKVLDIIMLQYDTLNSYSSSVVRVNINVDAQR